MTIGGDADIDLESAVTTAASDVPRGAMRPGGLNGLPLPNPALETENPPPNAEVLANAADRFPGTGLVCISSFC